MEYDHPRMKLSDFFEEVMEYHLDAAIPKSLDEFMSSPELQDKAELIIKESRQATDAILGISAKSGIPPPEVSTILHLGIIMGIGLVLELLNEREDHIN